MRSPIEICAELVASIEKAQDAGCKRDLADVFWGELAALAHQRFGTCKQVGQALQVHKQTVSRWAVCGRRTIVDVNTRTLLNQLAQVLLAQENSAAGIYARFERELATAAIAQAKGLKVEACILLGCTSDWLRRALQRQAVAKENAA